MASTEKPATILHLLRRWVVDYFNRHDASVCHEFVTPDYALRIGDITFAGRDAQWLPAVQTQMDQFPGLGMTVNRVLVGSDEVALLFTQHGASGGNGGKVTCWSGIAIYRSNGSQLCACVAQEDYMTRQRQLKSGLADEIAAPDPAPWDTPALPPDAQAEAIVRQWLGRSWPSDKPGVLVDDEHLTGAPPLVFEVTGSEVTDIFSSGSGVAFHARQTGRYRSGLAGVAASERAAVLHCNGIVDVLGGAVESGRIIRDRAGLRSSLRQA